MTPLDTNMILEATKRWKSTLGEKENGFMYKHSQPCVPIGKVSGVCVNTSYDENVSISFDMELSPDEYSKILRDHQGRLTLDKLWEDVIMSRYFILTIRKVIFNPPATIVKWNDGTKTVVKCKEGDQFDKWAGLSFCICKKILGDNFHKTFRKWCEEDKK